MSKRSKSGPASINYMMNIIEKAYGISFPKHNGNHVPLSVLKRFDFMWDSNIGSYVPVAMTCSKCEKGKTLNHFSIDKHCYFGVKTICKECKGNRDSERKQTIVVTEPLENGYVTKAEFDKVNEKLDALLRALGEK